MNVLEKILEEIGERIKNSDGCNENIVFVDGFEYGLIEARKVIRSHMNEVERGGWIPVEERLPDDDEEIVIVIVSGKYDTIEFIDAVMLGYYSHKDKEWVIDSWEEWKNPNVSAWMPIPEPYEPKRPTEQSTLTEREQFFTEGNRIYDKE